MKKISLFMLLFVMVNVHAANTSGDTVWRLKKSEDPFDFTTLQGREGYINSRFKKENQQIIEILSALQLQDDKQYDQTAIEFVSDEMQSELPILSESESEKELKELTQSRVNEAIFDCLDIIKEKDVTDDKVNIEGEQIMWKQLLGSYVCRFIPEQFLWNYDDCKYVKHKDPKIMKRNNILLFGGVVEGSRIDSIKSFALAYKYRACYLGENYSEKMKCTLDNYNKSGFDPITRKLDIDKTIKMKTRHVTIEGGDRTTIGVLRLPTKFTFEDSQKTSAKEAEANADDLD